MLNDINTVLPGFMSQLDNVATTLRDQVNNVVSPISGTIAAGALDQSASGSLQFNIGLDGGAFSTVSVAGADWSGAGGAAALQTALQNGLNTGGRSELARPRPLRRTPTARRGVDRADRNAHARGAGERRQRRHDDIARNDSGRFRRHRRPRVLHRYQRRHARSLGCGCEQPRRGRGRDRCQRPARRQRRAPACRHGHVDHRRGQRVQLDDRRPRCRGQGRADARQPAAAVSHAEPRQFHYVSSRGSIPTKR